MGYYLTLWALWSSYYPFREWYTYENMEWGVCAWSFRLEFGERSKLPVCNTMAWWTLVYGLVLVFPAARSRSIPGGSRLIPGGIVLPEPPSSSRRGTGDYPGNHHPCVSMGLLPDTQNYGLLMLRECRKRFPRHCGLAIPTCITARASRTCRDACRDR